MVVLAGLLLVPPVGSGPALAATPGTPWTWGSNSFGELGDGTNANHFTPAPATGFAAADAVELGGGREHVIALRTDGTVWTWGSSQYGQLGSGGTANRSTPGVVTGLAGVAQVAAGQFGIEERMAAKATVHPGGHDQGSEKRCGQDSLHRGSASLFGLC